MKVQIYNHPCDRCHKPETLYAYHFSPVLYRGKPIEKPWLCLKCFAVEKKKWYKSMEVKP